MIIENYYQDIKHEIARNVFAARYCIGYNHENLVIKSGITRPVISKMENSAANPSLETLLKLSKALNINLDLLTLSKAKYLNLSELLKPVYKNDNLYDLELEISHKYWKQLLTSSGSAKKEDIKIISKLCNKLIRGSFSDLNEQKLCSMVYCSALGVIFQEDGFMKGLKFGIWFGQNI